VPEEVVGAAEAAPTPQPGRFATLSDATLAYSFQYPVALASGRELTWVTTREPTRYASAAPLSADARQRIVCELANFKGPLTVSVTVGPPPPVLDLVGAPESWTPRQLAAALLADRSTGRVTSGQRISLASLEAVTSAVVDGGQYISFETVAQGSPTFVDPTAQTFRHAIGVTAGRDGYYYTLVLTAPERLWAEVQPLFTASVQSFRLTKPTESYRAPDTSSLQFW